MRLVLLLLLGLVGCSAEPYRPNPVDQECATLGVCNAALNPSLAIDAREEEVDGTIETDGNDIAISSGDVLTDADEENTFDNYDASAIVATWSPPPLRVSASDESGESSVVIRQHIDDTPGECTCIIDVKDFQFPVSITISEMEKAMLQWIPAHRGISDRAYD